MKSYEKEFERLLQIYDNEVLKLEYCYYAWKTINQIISEDADIYAAANSQSIFWNTVLYSLQSSMFVTLGRIFDTRGDAFSINTLIAYCIKYPKIFSKDQLKSRKIAEGLSGPPLEKYLNEKPADLDSIENFQFLSKEVSENRKIYEKYKDIRDKIHAHRSFQDIGAERELYEKTRIGELEELIRFLRVIKVYLWELFHNGRKINLNDEIEPYADGIRQITDDTKDLLQMLKENRN